MVTSKVLFFVWILRFAVLWNCFASSNPKMPSCLVVNVLVILRAPEGGEGEICNI